MVARILVNAVDNSMGMQVEALCESAAEIFIASAFMTADVVRATLLPAAERGARIRVLTGTYGSFNRKALFEMLLASESGSSFQTRIWGADGSNGFHAKLFLWRGSSELSEAWIGSANFTVGGLNNEGEIVLAERGAWSTPSIQRLRAAFESAWEEGRAIDQPFVEGYREASRPPPDSRLRAPRAVAKANGHVRMLVATIAKHYAKDSPVAQRIDEVLFPRNTLNWYRGSGERVGNVERGDLLCLVDRPTSTVSIVRAYACARDGASWVVTYYDKPVVAARRWDAATRKALARASSKLGQVVPRLGWLDAATTSATTRALRTLVRVP